MTDATEKRTDEAIVQMAAFRIGDEDYVIDIMRIKEIINPLKITPVPSHSTIIEGVINLRGVIIPMVDLRKRFGVPSERWSSHPKYIIVVVTGRIIGTIVDEVREVVRVPLSTIKPAPDLFEQREPGMFLGVCEQQGRLLLLIDLRKVLQPALSSGAPETMQSNPSKNEKGQKKE